jgi:hypothetical protein
VTEEKRRCSDCGAPPKPGRARCEQCLEIHRIKARARWAENPEAARAKDRAKRDRWRSSGRCTQCGRTKDREGVVLCYACRERSAKKQSRYMDSLMAEAAP